MPMCLKSHYVDSQDKLLLLIGYENGDLRLIQCVFGQPQSIYIEQSVKLHDQPVIDIDYFTISNVSEYMIKGYCVSVNDKLSNFVVDRDFRLVDCTNNTTNTYLKQLPYSSCTTVRVRQDGKFFVVGFWNGKMYVYSAKSYKLLCILNSGDVTCASFANPQDCHGTDRYLACGSAIPLPNCHSY
uniref:Uncharacterized protein n=1 Tax=Romanomermis culicivorax TaxID=13658 RepID=A0A915HWT6_ROMCU